MTRIFLLIFYMTFVATFECRGAVSTQTLKRVTRIDKSSADNVTLTNNKHNYSRFPSFTKLDNFGKKIPDNATSWSCVKDNTTGLIWEVKTSDKGLHDKSHTYTWFSSKTEFSDTSEGREGDPSDTTCGTPATIQAGCDTEKFVTVVNTVGWCGHNDWRLPTVDELATIVNYEASLPAISKNYFPDLIMPAGFWTASPYAANQNFAWIVIFDDGYLGSCVKSWAYYLRLVREDK